MKNNSVPRYTQYVIEELTKENLFCMVSDLSICHGFSNDREGIYAELIHREYQGCTIIEEGVAMPHIESDIVQQSTIVVVKTKHAIMKWNENASGIYVIVFLLLKKDEKKEILKEIQRFVRLLANEDVVDELKGIDSIEELENYIANM